MSTKDAHNLQNQEIINKTMKKYEITLTEQEYKRFKTFMLLISRFLDFYAENPDMEIVIKTHPKKWWQWK
jgi:hypothetical protein